MRSEKALKNMLASLLLQVIVFLSGVILPKFFLEAYGSSVNGMVTSINQFLMYLGLAEAGVGTASMVALYEPLACDDREKTNAVLSATRIFYNRSGFLFLGLTVGLTIIYPYLIAQQLNSMLVRSMILVLASSMLVDYFFLGKYKAFLTAKQKGYIVVSIQSVGTLVNMIVTIVLILQGAPVVLTKGVATGVYILRFFAVRWYVKHNYPEVDYHSKPDMSALHQRGAALLHQIVGIIVNNTDVVLLTICLGARSLIEVSVYGIYNMIVYALNMLLTSFSNGLTAGFGEVISKNEQEVLKKSFSSYEYMYMMILFVITGCMAVLILPFIMVYTRNVQDADYVRPVAAWLFVMIVFLQNVRIPGQTIICAAGHFKETRKQAILEAVINVSVSLLLVWKWGLVGVLFGTVCSYGYRSIEILVYNNKHLVHNSGKQTLKRLVRNFLVSGIIVLLGVKVIPQAMDSFVVWFLFAVLFAGVATISLLGVNYICEPHEFKALFRRVQTICKRT